MFTSSLRKTVCATVLAFSSWRSEKEPSINPTVQRVVADRARSQCGRDCTIFMFAYPPQDERRHRLFLILTRMALILMFCGFLLQVLATWDMC